MELTHALILAVIEGFTEFLPISSTGHMVIVSHFLHMPQSATLQTFEIVVQLGAIFAVMILYIKRLTEVNILKKLIVGFLPTGVIGFLLFPHIKSFLQNPILVAITMTLGGICILFVENWYSKQKELLITGNDNKELTYKEVFLLGIYQTFAMIPGVSRSGAMIIGGLTMRLPRKTITEFTFLLAVPTMLMATCYTLYKKHAELSFDAIAPIALGTSVSFIVALVVIRYFLNYIRSHSFSIFGWYRIIVGIILLLILI